MNRSIVECQHVSKSFFKGGSEIPVLKDINFQVSEGEMIAIVGSSGAGKSTLLHVLGTLEPVTSGSILYDGENISKFNSNQLALFRNKNIGFIFQFHHLLQEFTALENVLMPALIAGEPKEKYACLAKELLNDVGLSHRLDHRPAELSGGEQQRVAVARAIIMNPRVVFADEPTGNLDSENALKIHEILFDLNQTRGVTLLMVTHDQDIAGRFPRTIEMKDGIIL